MGDARKLRISSVCPFVKSYIIVISLFGESEWENVTLWPRLCLVVITSFSMLLLVLLTRIDVGFWCLIWPFVCVFLGTCWNSGPHELHSQLLHRRDGHLSLLYGTSCPCLFSGPNCRSSPSSWYRPQVWTFFSIPTNFFFFFLSTYEGLIFTEWVVPFNVTYNILRDQKMKCGVEREKTQFCHFCFYWVHCSSAAPHDYS